MAEGKRAEKQLDLQDLLTAGDVEGRIAALSFEQGLQLVEELVSRVESGALALDQSVLSYEKGVALIGHLRKLLGAAEERLRVLQESSEGIKQHDAAGNGGE